MTSAAGAVVDMMLIFVLFQGCRCCLICHVEIQLVKDRPKATIYNANCGCKVADKMINGEKTGTVGAPVGLRSLEYICQRDCYRLHFCWLTNASPDLIAALRGTRRTLCQ